MKKRESKFFRNEEFILIGVFIFLFALFLFGGKLTGKSVSEETHSVGPSLEEQNCMMQCMGCSSPGVGCTGNQEQCTAQCNVEKPEQTAEESCVETCVEKGCGEFDFSCQQKNQAVCDEECGMIKEPEAKSEEEQCIRDCVSKEDPDLRCQAGEGGEKGNEICQKCAKECEYLYEGPCLTEIELEEAKGSCNTCEHCYGKPVMGDSGEGYDCIIGIECADSSSEFGDEPGTGEGVAEKVTGAIGDAAGSVVDFFKGLFGIGEGSDDSGENTGTTNSENP